MHHETKYHLFYFFIIIGIIWGLRKICLKTLNIYEYITIGIFSNAFFMFLIILLTKGTKGFKIDTKKITPKIILYLILLGFLGASFTISWITMNKNEDLTILPALSSGTKIISVGLVGIIFLKEEITFKKIISSILILSGILFYFK